MSTQLTPSKRQHESNIGESSGKEKSQKTESTPNPSPSGISFRVLCPVKKIDSLSGEGEAFISHIQQETGTKVSIEETVAGCDERVVVIMGAESYDKVNEVSSEQSMVDAAEEVNVPIGGDEQKENGQTGEPKESSHAKNLNLDKETSSMQKALLLIFERIVEAEPNATGIDNESNKSSAFVLRLLVLSSQVGCLLGKGGSVIKQMTSESGAQIRILPRDKLPPCASATEELVQLMGNIDAVRKALQSVSQQLLGNPRDHESSHPNPTGQSSESFGPRQDINLLPKRHMISQKARPQGASFHSTAPLLPSRMKLSPEIVTFRLLCQDERVGVIIGKGGAVVKTIQQETNSEIRIVDGTPGSEERIIIVSGPAHPEDRLSGVQDAVLRVHARILRAIPDTKDKTVMARLLVSSNQIGCLLGKGGGIMAEMRKSTGAHIRILGKDQVPKCASEGEEVIQINGENEAVCEALLQITSRLQHHFFRDAFPSDHHPNPAYRDQMPPFPPYMGRMELSPPGLGPPFHHFDAFPGPPIHGGFHPHDDPPHFVHNIPRASMPGHLTERRPWPHQGFISGAGPMGLSDFSGASSRRISSFGGGQSAIITSTTVEVVVPRTLVPVIYGEEGACLRQIRQISDADITITDPKPGAAETVIIISGTPEQTHAAQSLIQAFVMSETESA